MKATPDDVMDLIGLILSCISLLFCLVILVSLIHSNHFSQSNHQTKPIVLNISYLTIISYLLSNGFHIAKHISADKIDDGNAENMTISTQIINAIIPTTWNLAQLFIYILLILRLHFSFIGTKYEIKKPIYLIFIVLIILYIVCCTAYTIFWATMPNIHHWTLSLMEIEHSIAKLYAICGEIIDFVISVLLICLFIKKMTNVTADLHSNYSKRFMDDRMDKINNEQKLLLDITAKYFILSFIATLWTQITIFLCSLAVILYFYAPNALILYNIVWFLYLVFFYADGIINPLCLYLLFETNKELYERVCHGCHAWARLCFRRITERKVKNNKDLSIQLLPSSM